jgi:lincosamide nucleotidyltransferase A/C/D/E
MRCRSVLPALVHVRRVRLDVAGWAGHGASVGLVEAADVVRVLDGLDEAGVRYWVAGGWGVAALAGAQTRRHRDLDLAVDAAGLGRSLAALGRLGYAVETDWLPSRIELRASGDRWVDVHPVTFGAGAGGRQADRDGGFFEYPPDAFSAGLIAGRSVPCLSAGQQRRFRAGYPHRPQDVHDLAQLDALHSQPRDG